jgi:hypothetical protein
VPSLPHCYPEPLNGRVFDFVIGSFNDTPHHNSLSHGSNRSLRIVCCDNPQRNRAITVRVEFGDYADENCTRHAGRLNSNRDTAPACASVRTVHEILAAAHDGSGLPACSATMYAAYQSGQFRSAAPVRFSCSPWATDARRIALPKSDAEAKLVAFESIRPGNRVVTSCNSHSLPSGSRKVA